MKPPLSKLSKQNQNEKYEKNIYQLPVNDSISSVVCLPGKCAKRRNRLAYHAYFFCILHENIYRWNSKWRCHTRVRIWRFWRIQFYRTRGVTGRGAVHRHITKVQG